VQGVADDSRDDLISSRPCACPAGEPMGPALAGKLEALADAHGAHAQLFDLCEAQGDWQRLLDHMAASAAGELECQWQASKLDHFSQLECHQSLKSCYQRWCGVMVLGPTLTSQCHIRGRSGGQRRWMCDKGAGARAARPALACCWGAAARLLSAPAQRLLSPALP